MERASCVFGHCNRRILLRRALKYLQLLDSYVYQRCGVVLTRVLGKKFMPRVIPGGRLLVVWWGGGSIGVEETAASCYQDDADVTMWL
jgi:hypothetical protein